MRTEDDRRRVRLALTHLEIAERELERTFNRIADVPGLGWRTSSRLDRQHHALRRLRAGLARRLERAGGAA